MAYTLTFSLLVAIPLGVFAASRASSVFDQGSAALLFFAASIPPFVVAYLLKQYLSIRWDVLPERGWEQPWDAGLVGHLEYVVMPVICLSLGQIAIYQRLLRSDMIATLQEDFITMAKSKGMSSRRILFRHALRPSSLTLLTVAGLSIGTLIGGSVVIERIFGIPGVGTDTVEALLAREYVALQSFIAIIGILYVLVNFAVDFLYTVLDPRIRYG
jgi:peptide/nickel transport system permease protein